MPPRSPSTAGASASTSACTTTPSSRPRSPGLEWDDDTHRWTIRTNRGDAMRAKYLAMGTGPLHRPKLPGIPGLERFEGHSFHTSRWDYDYTGGDPSGAPMTELADKRVGIIGTGATAVQCVPHLARAAGELYVFQRTPSSIDVRNNRTTDPDWFATLEPGWQKRVDGELHDAADRWVRRRGPRDGRLDRHLATHSRQAAVVARTRPVARRECSGLPRQRRREDGRDPRPGRRDHRRPRHRRGAEALVPATLQASVLPRRVPRRVQRAEHAPRRHRRQGRRARSPRPASSSTARRTTSTASSTHPGSRSAPSSPVAAGFDVVRARRRDCCPSTGPTA